MNSLFRDARLELIEQIKKHVIDKLANNDAVLVKEFAARFYRSASIDDLSSRSILDLYGAVVSHWHFIFQRLPGQTKIRLINPNQEEHGWQSIHTVVEIVTENLPFIVDSIRFALAHQDLNIHLMINMTEMKFIRDKLGRIENLLPSSISGKETLQAETSLYIEIDRQSASKVLRQLKEIISKTIQDVTVVVSDWQHMRAQIENCLPLLKKMPLFVAKKELKEAMAFLGWLSNDHFIFLGYAEYSYQEYNVSNKNKDNDKDVEIANAGCLEYVPDSGLGILSESYKPNKRYDIVSMSVAAREAYLSKQILIVGKTNTISTIHRPAYIDSISIKIFDKVGKLKEERRFVGLYTASAYSSNPKDIPFVRSKINEAFKIASLSPSSYDGKKLLNILGILPRDDLFHATEQELYYLSTEILQLQERQKIKLLIRKDLFGGHFSCLVFVSREHFNSELRQRIQNILLEELNGESINFSTQFSESILARIHFVVRTDPNKDIVYDINKIEKKFIDTVRTWKEKLHDALLEYCGEEKGNELLKQYGNAFPAGYREIFSPRMAVVDIKHIEMLKSNDETDLAMSLYRPIEDPDGSFRFKLFRLYKPFPLSDIVPILENMGLRIISERPYPIHIKNKGIVWINDYRMLQPEGETLSPELVKDMFQEAFAAIWYEKAENDGFNRLVLRAMLTWREIAVLRAYYKYLWQTGLGFSQNSVEDAFYNNLELARKLMQLFKLKFDLHKQTDTQTLEEFRDKIISALDAVNNLNEDRILRRYLHVIFATVRTNYFQATAKGLFKDYLSFKFESEKVPELPLPLPLYEIFVYSPRMEGIHLRGAKVARGGLRWSDRQEDFRTEILGLMKAQQVKNAVIVPQGAKGGFIVKNLAKLNSKDEQTREVAASYSTFVRGLLDLTDNLESGNIITPQNVVCYDSDDPYLVVAADKGTAVFSDIANEISVEYGFWLGDAFASGGATGYDHKKLGITARGAWESVKLHFQKLDHDIANTPFTVVGIGDMSGDVFGNGMLLSHNIKLIAAFNHAHIFLDPAPDPETSFKERERLFALPDSSWIDYNQDLLSEGGGVFWRTAKSIKLSSQVQKLLGVNKDKLLPNELIRAILMCNVDLLWNGGIGTFVKSTKESHAMVGNKSNDAVRVNADQLGCKIICEGGNLGLTPLARVEFAKGGGVLNTDAIDNSAGVNCSDNEVNIKVLLDEAIRAGDLTRKQRDQLLTEMSEDIVNLVLNNNRWQNDAITMAEVLSVKHIDAHERLIKELEKTINLKRQLEDLPNEKEISIRKANNQGLTRPELAILMAHSKTMLKNKLLDSDILEDPFVCRELEYAFPKVLRVRFKSFIEKHYLKQEIIATRVSNLVINEMGMNFISQLHDETGLPTTAIVRAYMVAREVFKYLEVKSLINNLPIEVVAEVKLSMVREINRLIRKSTRWILRNYRDQMDITTIIERFSPTVCEIQSSLSNVLVGSAVESFHANAKHLIDKGISQELAYRISSVPAMFSALDIVEIIISENLSVPEVARVYFAIGARLELDWFREQIKCQAINNHWDILARAAFRDDVDKQQRNLTVAMLQSIKDVAENQEGVVRQVESWLQSHQALLNRWEYFIAEFKTSVPEFTMFAVALRELLDLSDMFYDINTRMKDK